MNANDISHAKDPDLRACLGALRRAAQQARQTAIQTGDTPRPAAGCCAQAAG